MNKWNKLSWKQRNNSKKYIKIDSDGLPKANTKGEFVYERSFKKATNLMNSMKLINDITEEKINKQKQNITNKKVIQENYKHNAKEFITEKDLKNNNTNNYQDTRNS